MTETDLTDAYARTLRQQFIEAPEYRSPAEFAARFHELLIGWGNPLGQEAGEARYRALSDLSDLQALTAAAGQELAKHYLMLDALTQRFAAHLSKTDPERERSHSGQAMAVRWLELTVKASKEARRCLAASTMLAQDLRVVGWVRPAEGDAAE